MGDARPWYLLACVDRLNLELGHTVLLASLGRAWRAAELVGVISQDSDTFTGSIKSNKGYMVGSGGARAMSGCSIKKTNAKAFLCSLIISRFLEKE